MTTFKLKGVASLWMGVVVSIPVAIATLLPTFPAQANDLTEIFADPSVPMTLQLNTLDENWKRLSLDQESLAPSVLFGISGVLESAFKTNVYYTEGKTVTIAKQEYLVVYRPEGRNISLADLMRSGRNKSPEDLIQPLTPESNLALSLINLSMIDGLRDIQPFNLQREIEESKEAIPEKPEPPEAVRKPQPGGQPTPDSK